MKKKKSAKRSKTSFSAPQVHSEKISAYKYDEKPSTLMKSSTDNGKMSLADTELKRMVTADVFRSANETIKKTNSNKRRYA